jgi:N-methylhydantoinase A/oxoprolinase/acetone carboxylase beta subunit
MGAAPGPACYGLGGDQATLTDALLVLGHLDPAGFLGGRRRLDTHRARAALESRVAEPLGVPVEDAARRIADAAVGTVAELVGSTLARAGIDAGEAVLFAYGGNGGLFAGPVAERLGIGGARVFALGPVLSAFGSAVSDVVHVYERSLGVAAGDGRDAVVAAARDMEAAGRRDLAAEGFDPDEAETEVELDAEESGARRTARGGDAASALAGLGDAARVDVVRVRARQRLAACHPPPRAGGAAAEPALRTVLLTDGGATQAPVHDWTALAPGSRIGGPALAAGGSMTCLVPPGWELEVDDLGDAALRRVGG